MTNEEVIERLEDEKKCVVGVCDETCKYWAGHECHKAEWRDTQRGAIDIAISALEKQIPKKIGEDGYGWYECPECHNKRPNWLLGKDAKWCPYCGQKLVAEEGEKE